MSGHGHDDWFRHGSDEGVPQTEHAAHISPAALGITFVGITFGVVALILILSLYFTSYTTNIRSTRQEGTQAAGDYLAYRTQSKSRLGKLEFIDRENGVVRVPIERAMEMVTAEYRGGGDAVSSTSN